MHPSIVFSKIVNIKQLPLDEEIKSTIIYVLLFHMVLHKIIPTNKSLESQILLENRNKDPQLLMGRSTMGNSGKLTMMALLMRETSFYTWICECALWLMKILNTRRNLPPLLCAFSRVCVCIFSQIQTHAHLCESALAVDKYHIFVSMFSSTRYGQHFKWDLV